MVCLVAKLMLATSTLTRPRVSVAQKPLTTDVPSPSKRQPSDVFESKIGDGYVDEEMRSSPLLSRIIVEVGQTDDWGFFYYGVLYFVYPR